VADAARRIADHRGTSVSALAARGLRDQVAAAAAAAYPAWLAANPEVAGWRAAADASRRARWAQLGGDAE
jgi:hypothetical protein